MFQISSICVLCQCLFYKRFLELLGNPTILHVSSVWCAVKCWTVCHSRLTSQIKFIVLIAFTSESSSFDLRCQFRWGNGYSSLYLAILPTNFILVCREQSRSLLKCLCMPYVHMLLAYNLKCISLFCTCSCRLVETFVSFSCGQSSLYPYLADSLFLLGSQHGCRYEQLSFEM